MLHTETKIYAQNSEREIELLFFFCQGRQLFLTSRLSFHVAIVGLVLLASTA